MSQIAKDFLDRCFAPDETVAVLLRRENPLLILQRVMRLERVRNPRYLAWLTHENGAGFNIYASANPLRPGARKRTKENVALVRHLYVDIDSDGDVQIAALRAPAAVPMPTAIISTSPGRYQALWRVKSFDVAHQEEMLKLLSINFGGDRACTDCNRLLRLPGFLNHKYDPPHHVTVEHLDDSIWTPDDFRLNARLADAQPFAKTARYRKSPSKRSHSESDWAWVSQELSNGRDAAELTQELASRRADKPNPLYYAQRTVDVASARLSFLGGATVEDVIAMLETRRSFEIPAAFCAARAREIAATAQRMIAKKKTA